MSDFPEDDSHKLFHPTLYRVSTMPKRRPSSRSPACRKRVSAPPTVTTPIEFVEHPSESSSISSFEQNPNPKDCHPTHEDKTKEPDLKPIFNESADEMGKEQKIGLPSPTIVEDSNHILKFGLKDSPRIKEKSNHHILQETIETTVETKEPSIFQKNNEKQVDNQMVDSKSLAKVLSDFIFVIIGILFCIRWGQVILPAIPILIVLVAMIIILELWMKNFKI